MSDLKVAAERMWAHFDSVKEKAASGHVCTVCFEPSEDHDAECVLDEVHQQHSHFPELCCPGCDCGSFERAHTEAELAYLEGNA